VYSAASKGLIFVPALSGLACPHWDRSARGSWMGLSLHTTATDMVQAVLEGVAFRTAEVFLALERNQPVTGRISLDGRMTENAFFVQFLSNVLQQNRFRLCGSSASYHLGRVLRFASGVIHCGSHCYCSLRRVGPETHLDHFEMTYSCLRDRFMGKSKGSWNCSPVCRISVPRGKVLRSATVWKIC
jgi:hypothetical protein